MAWQTLLTALPDLAGGAAALGGGSSTRNTSSSSSNVSAAINPAINVSIGPGPTDLVTGGSASGSSEASPYLPTGAVGAYGGGPATGSNLYDDISAPPVGAATGLDLGGLLSNPLMLAALAAAAFFLMKGAK
jgi:hypothetical protein